MAAGQAVGGRPLASAGDYGSEAARVGIAGAVKVVMCVGRCENGQVEESVCGAQSVAPQCAMGLARAQAAGARSLARSRLGGARPRRR